MATTTSAFTMVDSRCAITIVVRPCRATSSASCTTFSDAASSALVISSANKIRGRFTSARAIAMRCFCPPDSCAPRCPTRVS
mmetsp:Transcript_3087/g.7536  ORF Transcript_3087/g.7536 Transcript_3087/m.7536 type:complete len:82 (+) Transcript_3087:2059-2304(+)